MTAAETLRAALCDRLGDDWYEGMGDVTFELTREGRTIAHTGGMSFFLRDDETELCAYRVLGGHVQFFEIGEGRAIKAAMAAPLADPAQN